MALAIKARKIYNAGLIVSLLLNIPVGSAVVVYFLRKGIIESLFLNPHFLIGLGADLLLPLLGGVLFRNHIRKIENNNSLQSK